MTEQATRPLSASPISDQSLGELVSNVTRDLSGLIRMEVELAKTEISAEAKRAGIGAGFLGGAGAFGVYSLLFLSFAAAFGISEGLGVDTWIGFIAVGGLWLLIAGVLAFKGIGSFSKLGPPKRTIGTIKDDIAWAKHPTTATAATKAL